MLSRCGHSSRSANRLEERCATTTICGKLESCVDRVAFIFYCPVMSKKSTVAPSSAADESRVGTSRHKPSSLLDTRVVYCGDNLEQIPKLPPASIDLIYIDPPFNSNRNYEVFWGETKEMRAFEDRHDRPAPTSITCARAAWNWPAYSRRPEAFIIIATGMRPIT